MENNFLKKNENFSGPKTGSESERQHRGLLTLKKAKKSAERFSRYRPFCDSGHAQGHAQVAKHFADRRFERKKQKQKKRNCGGEEGNTLHSAWDHIFHRGRKYFAFRMGPHLS